MKIKIRKTENNDWQTIQKLNNEVFQSDKENDPDMDLNWPFSEVGIKYYQDLCSGDYGHCVIAEINKKPVGYVALSVKDFGYRKSKYIEIENIGVTPSNRSQGIGKKLMEYAEQWAKKRGSNKLYVEAFWKNTRAIKFYKNNGYTEIGIELEKTI